MFKLPHQLVPVFAEGVYFVELAEVVLLDQVLPAHQVYNIIFNRVFSLLSKVQTHHMVIHLLPDITIISF